MRKLIFAGCLIGAVNSTSAWTQDTVQRTEPGGSGTIIASTKPIDDVATKQIRGKRGDGSVYGGILPGLVLDSNGSPLSGARVNLITSSNERTITVVSDANGRFSIDGLAAGDYNVSVTGGVLSGVEAERDGGLLLRMATNPAVRTSQAPRSVRFGFRFLF